jgi:O-antigen/teichoic acid export membrane protein
LLYLDIFKHFLQNEEYWEGLKIVPIIMMANIFLGIYMNLSMWYKLSGQTHFGAWFSVLGAIITLGFNYFFIPRWGYMASAWATLLAYFTMMMISYFLGQRYYPIPYNVRKIILYILVSLTMYGISSRIPFDNKGVVFIINTLLFFPFFYTVYIFEKPIRDFIQALLKKYGIEG